MKIALLAPSGAGKTVYLTGLYGIMTDFLNSDNYGIDTQFTNRVQNGYLKTRYTKLLDDGNFGEPTQDIRVYPVTLSAPAADRSIKRLSIELVDFPGGALSSATEENQEEVEKIVGTLSQCDGFIVLLDGETVVKNVNKPLVARSKLKSSDIRNVLNEALERRRTRIATEKTDPNAYSFGSGKTPVMFALTKGDIVSKWLSSQGENVRPLQGLVQEQFKTSAGKQVDSEGDIASLIRSQYAHIIDAPDVISARFSIHVFDEARNAFNPRNVAYMTQLVLFTGLMNAETEYLRRLQDWQNDEAEKKKKFQSETGAYERAVSAKRAYDEQWIGGQIFDDLFGFGESEHNQRIKAWHKDMTVAADAHNSSQLSVKQVRENLATAALIRQRVLPEKLAYLLSKGNTREGFYISGLPLDMLAKEKWWQERCRAGQQIVEQRDPPSGPSMT